MDIRDLIEQHLPFFKETELKKKLAETSKLVEVDAGTPILNEGAYVKTIPILLSGLAKVARQEAGKELLIYHIYPLESCIVSIHCGLNDAKSPVKAITEEPSSALLLPASQFAVWQRSFPSLNDYVLKLYQRRFDNVLDAFNALAFHSLDERLLTHLQSRAKAIEGNKITATHQELGDELGTARETVSRILKKLEVDGKVNLHRGWIEVLKK